MKKLYNPFLIINQYYNTKIQFTLCTNNKLKFQNILTNYHLRCLSIHIINKSFNK